MRGMLRSFDKGYNQQRKTFNLMFNLVIGFICLVLLVIIAWWLFVGSLFVTHGDSIMQAFTNLINAGANHLNK